MLRPPLAEQTAIAAYLDLESTKINGIIDNLTAQIGLLHELRKTLINEAVTGKIDVRTRL